MLSLLLTAGALAAPPPVLAAGALPAVRAAYDVDTVALCGDPAGGTAEIVVSVAAGGGVAAAVVRDATVSDASLGCLLAGVSAWRFADAGTARVELVFSPEPPPMDAHAVDGVRWVLQRNRAQLQACYEQALRAEPDLSGSLEVLVWVDGGHVSASHVRGDPLLAGSVGGCLQRRLAAWVFPDAVTGELALPLALSPAG